MEFLARMSFHLFLVLFVAVAVPISMVVALVAIIVNSWPVAVASHQGRLHA
jgi:hypothetical protein